MARRVVINNTKTYFNGRFQCGALRWKPEDKNTKIAWCTETNNKCSLSACPKVKNNKTNE